VQGIAGRVGLRRGDTVTHVNGDRVTTFSEYTIALQYAYSDASVLITVNANEAVAQQLSQRSQQMKEQNVRFHG
jgi:S1-C subfamily serine protease